MSSFTFNEVFGTNATQDDNNIILSKNDLQATGFVADNQNSPESILAAIILTAYKAGLTNTNRDGDLSPLSDLNFLVAINDPTTIFVDRVPNGDDNGWVRRDSFAIDFDSPINVSFSPGAY